MELSREHLEHLLQTSDLLQAPAALEALRAGATLENSANATDGQELRNTYARRADRLASKKSAHALQLVASMEEFCKRMQGPHPVTFLILKPPAEHEFLIFWCPADDSLVGCQKTIAQTAVSKQRWEELWADPIPLESVQRFWSAVQADAESAGSEKAKVSREGQILLWCNQEWIELVCVPPRLATALLDYLGRQRDAEIKLPANEGR